MGSSVDSGVEDAAHIGEKALNGELLLGASARAAVPNRRRSSGSPANRASAAARASVSPTGCRTPALPIASGLPRPSEAMIAALAIASNKATARPSPSDSIRKMSAAQSSRLGSLWKPRTCTASPPSLATSAACGPLPATKSTRGTPARATSSTAATASSGACAARAHRDTGLQSSLRRGPAVVEPRRDPQL